MVEPKDTGMEELLHYTVQRTEDGEAGDVLTNASCKWYAKKHKKRRWLSVSKVVSRLVRQCGLESFL